MVLLSRIVGGFGIGWVIADSIYSGHYVVVVVVVVRVLFQVVPLYVAEISPEALRGRLQSFSTVYGTSGALVRC